MRSMLFGPTVGALVFSNALFECTTLRVEVLADLVGFLLVDVSVSG